jgi:hypothetical protein
MLNSAYKNGKWGKIGIEKEGIERRAGKERMQVTE